MEKEIVTVPVEDLTSVENGKLLIAEWTVSQAQYAINIYSKDDFHL